MQYTAIFVDLDGTLADSLPVLFKVYCNFLESMGKEGTLEEFQMLMGPSMPEVLHRLRTTHGLEDDLPKLLEKYLEHLVHHYANGIPLFPGAREFLHAWSEEFSLSLVTSAPSRLANFFLKQHELEEYFQGIFTGEMVAKLKPEPDIYLHALKKTGLSPEKVLAIEDSPAGVIAAQRAGIKAIMLMNGQSAHSGEPPEGATVVKGWQELHDLLHQWS